MIEKLATLRKVLFAPLLLLWSPVVEAQQTFVPPVAGAIRSSTCPADESQVLVESEPRTWYTMAWAGRYEAATPDDRCERTGGHPGVDIRDGYGESRNDLGIYAIGDGVVIRYRRDRNWGKFVVVRHDLVEGLGTIYSIYAHLESFAPKIVNGREGEIRVARGEGLGTMGATGNTSGRHLHFQVDRSWWAQKVSPFWPTITVRDRRGRASAKSYPASQVLCGSSIDACLSEAQRTEAVAQVEANTVNPMWLVENVRYRTDECVTTAITIDGSNRNDTISDGDCSGRYHRGGKAKFYSFSGRRGQVIALSAAGDFDSYLTLVSPGGRVIAANNNCPGWGSTACLMDFRLPVDGVYSIEVTTASGSGSGSFELALISGRVCTLVVGPSRLNFGEITVGDRGEGVVAIQNQIGCPVVSGTVSVTLSPPFLLPDGGGFRAEAAQGVNVRVSFAPESAGFFEGQIVFDSNRGRVSKPVSGSAIGITCPAVVLTPQNFAAGSLTSSDCRSARRQGANTDLWSFSGATGQIALVVVNSDQFDTYAYLLGDNGGVLGENDNASTGSTNSQVQVNGLPYRGTYYIEVTSRSAGATGTYSIAIYLYGP